MVWTAVTLLEGNNEREICGHHVSSPGLLSDSTPLCVPWEKPQLDETPSKRIFGLCGDLTFGYTKSTDCGAALANTILLWLLGRTQTSPGVMRSSQLNLLKFHLPGFLLHHKLFFFLLRPSLTFWCPPPRFYALSFCKSTQSCLLSQLSSSIPVRLRGFQRRRAQQRNAVFLIMLGILDWSWKNKTKWVIPNHVLLYLIVSFTAFLNTIKKKVFCPFTSCS